MEVVLQMLFGAFLVYVGAIAGGAMTRGSLWGVIVGAMAGFAVVVVLVAGR